MLNDSSSQKDELNPDQFFLPGIPEPVALLQEPKQIIQAKTKVPIIIQGSMPDENLITYQKLQAFFQQQQQILHSQDALASHYLNLSQVIKQIQSQQSLQHLDQQSEHQQCHNNEQEEYDYQSGSKRRKMVKNASATNFKQIQQIKGNVKNAYIKKITSLLNLAGQEEEESSEMSQDVNQRQFYKNLRNKGILGSTSDLLSLEEKSLKMKESAKNSRMRKKVYITMLEKKVEEFQDRIGKYQTGAIESMKFVEGVLSSSDPIGSLVMGQVQLQTHLKNSRNKSENNEEQMLLQDSYQMRFGTFGVKRKAYMRFCFQNIGRLLLQSNYGMMLFGSGDKAKSRSEEFNDYVREFKQVTGVHDDNQTYRILSIIHQLLDHRKKYEKQQILLIISLIKLLSKEYNQLRKIQSQLDDTVNSTLQVLSPQQSSELIEQSSNFRIPLFKPNLQKQAIEQPIPQNDAYDEGFLDLEGKKKCYF